MNHKNTQPSNILIPISLGELIDKITILEIKKEIMDGAKLKNVIKELEYLKLIIKDQKIEIDPKLLDSLKKTNNNLWEIEDQIRLKEKKRIFDKDFIKLARSVYKENDQRALLKKEINIKYKSNLIEEKSCEDY